MTVARKCLKRNESSEIQAAKRDEAVRKANAFIVAAIELGHTLEGNSFAWPRAVQSSVKAMELLVKTLLEQEHNYLGDDEGFPF